MPRVAMMMRSIMWCALITYGAPLLQMSSIMWCAFKMTYPAADLVRALMGRMRRVLQSGEAVEEGIVHVGPRPPTHTRACAHARAHTTRSPMHTHAHAYTHARLPLVLHACTCTRTHATR